MTKKPVKRIPDEWSRILGILVLDPDGWNRRDFEKDWFIPLTQKEFEKKAFISTIQSNFNWAESDEKATTNEMVKTYWKKYSPTTKEESRNPMSQSTELEDMILDLENRRDAAKEKVYELREFNYQLEDSIDEIETYIEQVNDLIQSFEERPSVRITITEGMPNLDFDSENL